MKTKEQIIHRFWKNISIHFTHRSINEFCTRHYYVAVWSDSTRGEHEQYLPINKQTNDHVYQKCIFLHFNRHKYTRFYEYFWFCENRIPRKKGYNGKQISSYLQLRTPYSLLRLGAWGRKAMHSPTAGAREAIVRPSLFHLDSRTDRLLPLWPGPLMVCSLRYRWQVHIHVLFASFLLKCPPFWDLFSGSIKSLGLRRP